MSSYFPYNEDEWEKIVEQAQRTRPNRSFPRHTREENTEWSEK